MTEKRLMVMTSARLLLTNLRREKGARSKSANATVTLINIDGTSGSVTLKNRLPKIFQNNGSVTLMSRGISKQQKMILAILRTKTIPDSDRTRAL